MGAVRIVKYIEENYSPSYNILDVNILSDCRNKVFFFNSIKLQKYICKYAY